jgi:hypothetical protein
LAGAGAHAAVHRGAFGAGQVSGQGSHGVGSDAGARLGDLGAKRHGQLLEPDRTLGLAGQPGPVDQVLAEQHVQQGQQQEGVAVGNDTQPLELGGGLGLARIDHQHPAAALDDVVHAVLDSRHGEHAAVGHDRVRADDHEQVGAKHIGHRQRQRRAVQQLAGHEAVVDVLRTRGEYVQPRAESGHEHRQAQGV